MKTENEINQAIEDLRTFLNTEVGRGLMTEEGKKFLLDRINTLKWVLNEL